LRCIFSLLLRPPDDKPGELPDGKTEEKQDRRVEKQLRPVEYVAPAVPGRIAKQLGRGGGSCEKGSGDEGLAKSPAEWADRHASTIRHVLIDTADLGIVSERCGCELVRMGAGFAELLLVRSGSECEAGNGDAARVSGSTRECAEASDAHADRGVLPGGGTSGGRDAGARVVSVEVGGEKRIYQQLLRMGAHRQISFFEAAAV
jgi:hypothetical protein